VGTEVAVAEVRRGLWERAMKNLHTNSSNSSMPRVQKALRFQIVRISLKYCKFCFVHDVEFFTHTVPILITLKKIKVIKANNNPSLLKPQLPIPSSQ